MVRYGAVAIQVGTVLPADNAAQDDTAVPGGGAEGGEDAHVASFSRQPKSLFIRRSQRASGAAASGAALHV